MHDDQHTLIVFVSSAHFGMKNISKP